MKGSSFVFDYVGELFFKRDNINLNCGGSCIGSLEWIKSNNIS